MSLSVKVDQFDDEKINKMNNELILTIKPKFGTGLPDFITQYHLADDQVILPFAYGVRELGFSSPPRNNYESLNIKCTVQPRSDDQKAVIDEALHILGTKKSVIISAYTGFGKTFCAIKLICNIRLRALIVTKGRPLVKQWKGDILEFCPDAHVQILEPSTKIEDADFYIINAQNVGKFGKNAFSSIGTLVVDEAHLIMAEAMSRSMKYIFPRYVLGLTATPFRPDGLDKLLDFYFGENKIIRKLNHKHFVYRVDTGMKPVVEYSTATGIKRVVWDSVLRAQAEDFERNRLIVNILRYFSDRHFIVLVKRVAHGKAIASILEEYGESYTTFMDSDQTFDKEARILIGTTSKVGVGFNHPVLDALLLATDLQEYFIQFLGRVFRRKDVEPVIVDLVDNFGPLIKHYKTRESVYIDHGGILKRVDKKIFEH